MFDRSTYSGRLKMVMHGLKETGLDALGVGIINFEKPYFEHPYQLKGRPERFASDMVIALSNIGLHSSERWAVRLEDTIRVTESQPISLDMGVKLAGDGLTDLWN